MTKKEKIKNWFKQHFNKNTIINWVFVGLIFVIVILCIYFENKDKKQMQTKQADINFIDDSIDLNLNYHLDSEGNIVSDNLLNPSYILLQYTTNDDGLPVVSSNNNRAVTNYLPISSNTTYTITCTNNLFIRELNFASDVGVGLGYNSINATNYTFTTPSNAHYLILLFGVGNQPDSYFITLDDIKNNCMLNVGSSALSFEPYGIWYFGTNRNNPFYNSSLYYYFSLSSSLSGYDVSLTDSILNGNTFIYPYRAIQTKYDSEETRAYIEDTQLGYWRLNFAKPFPVSLLNFKVLCTTTSNFDYCITYYFNDGSNYVYHNIVSSSLTEFIIDLSEVSDLSGKECIYMTWRRQSSYEINCLSIANYEMGFIDGSNEGYHKGLDDGIAQGQSNGYDNGYNVGYQEGLNEGINQDFLSNGFTVLLNSIFSYPINFISSVFNFEFMGVNVASILLFLVSVGVVLFVVKRLWK